MHSIFCVYSIYPRAYYNNLIYTSIYVCYNLLAIDLLYWLNILCIMAIYTVLANNIHYGYIYVIDYWLYILYD